MANERSRAGGPASHLVAGACAAATAVSLLIDPVDGDALRWFAAASAALATAWTIRLRVPSLALLLAAAAVLLGAEGLPDRVPVSSALLMAAAAAVGYLTGRHTDAVRSTAVVFGVAATAGIPLGLALTGQLRDWFIAMSAIAGMVLVPWALGHWIREEARRRASDRMRDNEQARAQERARIAYEMHDSLGHLLSLAALRAGALEVDPAVGASHREAVGELRAAIARAADRLEEIIGVLDTGPDSARTDDLEDLFERARSAGMDLTVRVDRLPANLPRDIEQTIHRVAQEALTNTTKHSPDSPVAVDLTAAGDWVAITVRNPVTRPFRVSKRAGGGRGLVGLRERVRLVGGEFKADADANGVFIVDARLPLRTSCEPLATGRGEGE